MKRNCVVTGATAGLGRAIAVRLAEKGHRVGIVGRTGERAAAAIAFIRKQVPGAVLEPLSADLASPMELRRLGEQIRVRFEQLDILVHCAGSFHSKRTLTEAGFETTFAVNHLAVFQLTHESIPVLRRSSGARILVTGSETHRHAKIHFEDLNLTKSYHGLRAYAQSKLANLLFTLEFHRRCPDGSMTAACVEPGLVRTDIGCKHAGFLHSLVWRLQLMLFRPAQPGVPAGWIAALADSDPAPPGGLYWSKGRPRPAAPPARQPDASRLWELSLKQCRIGDYFGQAASAEDSRRWQRSEDDRA